MFNWQKNTKIYETLVKAKVEVKVDVETSLSIPWRHIGGRRNVTLLILNLGTRLRSEDVFTPRPFYPWKEPGYPLTRRLGGSQIRSGRFEEGEEILLPLPRQEPRTVRFLAWPHSKSELGLMWYIYIYIYIYIYVVGSKSFWPDQLFKVTEIKQLCHVST